MLVLSGFLDQEFFIGDNVVVQVVEIRGNMVRLGFTAPPEVRIDRKVVHEDILRHGVRRRMPNSPRR